MKKTFKSIVILFLLFSSQAIYAQTNEEKALAKGQEAVALMDKGKYDESIVLLKEAQKLDPKKLAYTYEIAYAYVSKQEYKEAIKILEKNKKHKDVNDRLFQLLGNAYDLMGDSEKAMDTYDEGLKKFPNSGIIYLEKGNVFWAKKEYVKALPFYEKGIEVEPQFASNYYRAARIYCGSSEEVWGMIYGEIFMNLERNSNRTAEISKLLFKTYKSEIIFTNDTSMSVSFSKNATINISDLNDLGKLKMPFGIGVYEPTLLISVINEKSITLSSLDRIRTNFVENFFKNGNDKNYPNVLFNYQKTVKEAGHLEAYNYWILSKGEEQEFERWKIANKDKWENFINWFSDNGLRVDENNKFYRDQY